MLETIISTIMAFESLLVAALLLYATYVIQRVARTLDKIESRLDDMEHCMKSLHPEMFSRAAMSAYQPPATDYTDARTLDRHPLLEEDDDDAPPSGDATDRFLGPRLRL